MSFLCFFGPPCILCVCVCVTDASSVYRFGWRDVGDGGIFPADKITCLWHGVLLLLLLLLDDAPRRCGVHFIRLPLYGIGGQVHSHMRDPSVHNLRKIEIFNKRGRSVATITHTRTIRGMRHFAFIFIFRYKNDFCQPRIPGNRYIPIYIYL